MIEALFEGGKRKEGRLQGRLDPYYPFLRHFHIIITVVTVILSLLKDIITSVITLLLHITTSVVTSLLHVITEIMDHCYTLLQ